MFCSNEIPSSFLLLSYLNRLDLPVLSCFISGAAIPACCPIIEFVNVAWWTLKLLRVSCGEFLIWVGNSLLSNLPGTANRLEVFQGSSTRPNFTPSMLWIFIISMFLVLFICSSLIRESYDLSWDWRFYWYIVSPMVLGEQESAPLKFLLLVLCGHWHSIVFI